MPSFQSKLFDFYWRLTREKSKGSRLREQVEHGEVDNVKPPKRMHEQCRITTTRVNGHAVYAVSPKQVSGPKHIYYLHGGGYVGGFGESQWRLIGKLVAVLDCTVHAPDYPLPPRYHVDDVFAMVVPTYRGLVANVDPANVTIMGDSAGGGMSLALAQELRAEGLPQPANIILLSPWLDVTMTNPEIKEVDPLDPLISVEGLIDAGKFYAGDADRRSPRISPVYGSLKGLGHITLFIGTHDTLMPDCRKLKAQAEAEGVALDYREWKDMPHVWMFFSLPEAQRVQREIIEILRTN